MDARMRFGKFCLYGTSMLGDVWFGDEDVVIEQVEYGMDQFGIAKLGGVINLSGIYALFTKGGARTLVRKRYYFPRDPKKEAQQANRQKFAGAVLAWQNLTSEQKSYYNEFGKRNGKRGYNVFLKRHLLFS